MIVERISLDGDPEVVLTAYVQEPSEEMNYTQKKPALLIFPGGGYLFVSDREAEVVALQYLKEGYQCFVLKYSLGEKSVFPRPLHDAEAALSLIREHAEKWHLDPQKVAIIGFSAGAHLATMLATSGRVRPNALIAGYPAFYPIPEIHYDYPLPVVDEKTPEAFIFHTWEDGFVPVKNAFYLAQEYQNHAIPFELHVFRDGGHGLSLGNLQVKNGPDFPIGLPYGHWLELSIEWLDRVLKPFR
jgi:predicted esterase